MAYHLAEISLEDFFKGTLPDPDADAHVAHLWACRACQAVASATHERVREAGHLASSPLAAAVALLMRAEERHEGREMRFRSLLDELKKKTPGEQLKHLRSVKSVHNQVFFEVLLEEVAVLWHTDARAAEHLARLAKELVDMIPRRHFQEALRNDLQAEALIYLANCRRLYADWSGAHRALAEARELLRRGTGSPRREALLLSVSATLAAEVGQLEAALALLERSNSLYHTEGDHGGLAWTGIQAGTMNLAAGNIETALQKAKEVLTVPGLEPRNEMLARGIVIEALILSGRPREAKKLFSDSRRLFSQFPESASRVSYLEARLLEAAGNFRDAERRLKVIAQHCLDNEAYKDALMAYLTLFEMNFKRKSFEKAAQVCEEVLEKELLLSDRPSIRKAWEDLAELVRSGAVSLPHLVALRQFCLRYWSVPAPNGPFAALAVAVSPFMIEEAVAVPEAIEAETATTLPVPLEKEAPLLGDAYHEALHQKERELFSQAFAACNFSLRRLARELDISRTTVKEKVRKFGLKADLKGSEPSGD